LESSWSDLAPELPISDSIPQKPYYCSYFEQEK